MCKIIKKFFHFSMQRKGFTLIELLVVIAIIGLLASVVAASVNGARGKARFARMVSDFRQIGLAAEFFLDAQGLYSCDSPPGYDADFNAGGRYSPPSEVGITCQNKGIVETGLLPQWPKPPCAGFDYDWENWSPAIAIPTGPGQVVRVTLRGLAPLYPGLYYYCIYDTHGSTDYKCGGRTGDAGYTLGGVIVNGTNGGSLSCS